MSLSRHMFKHLKIFVLCSSHKMPQININEYSIPFGLKNVFRCIFGKFEHCYSSKITMCHLNVFGVSMYLKSMRHANEYFWNFGDVPFTRKNMMRLEKKTYCFCLLGHNWLIEMLLTFATCRKALHWRKVFLIYFLMPPLKTIALNINS